MMLITALVAFAAEKVISFTLPAFLKFLAGTIVTSSAASGLGVYLYTRKSDSENDQLKAKGLEALQNERKQQCLTTQKEAEALVLSAANDASTIQANTAQQQALITTATQSLDSEIQTAKAVNLQMLDATALLARLGESMSQESMPIIKELGCRLEALPTTTEALDGSLARLQHLERLLQDTVSKHSALQEKLEQDVFISQNKRDFLSKNLEEVVTLLGDPNKSLLSADLFARASAYIERLSTKIAALESSLSESSAKLVAVVQVNRALKEENRVLINTLRQFSQANNVLAESSPSLSKWNGPGMFTTTLLT